MGYERDKLDILNKAYVPMRWQEDDSHIRKKEDLLVEILEGKRNLNVNLTPTPKTKKNS